METVLVQINNIKAYKLLEDLEVFLNPFLMSPRIKMPTPVHNLHLRCFDKATKAISSKSTFFTKL